jgi:hypothetical protein
VKRIDVVKKGDEWVGKTKSDVVARAPTKVEAVRKTARVARATPEPTTVKIHKENGQMQEERTYPRRADPRKSKG